jgi:uncharacterized Zn finger protein
MSCTRCMGLMVQDHMIDFEGTSGYMWTKSWRCMNCGNVHDSVTEHNRRLKAEPVIVTTGEPDYQDEEVHLGRESYLARVA